MALVDIVMEDCIVSHEQSPVGAATATTTSSEQEYTVVEEGHQQRPNVIVVDDDIRSTDVSTDSSVQLPDELLQYIGNQFLNPAERSRLATCNSHLRELLPTPLRIKVVSSRGDSSLQSEFFVSDATHTDADTDTDAYDAIHTDHQTNHMTEHCPSKFLLSHQSLYFGRKYHLWTFDYQRGNKVYLGRHTRHGHKASVNGELQYLYTMGLRPRSPNQTWEVIGGEAGDTVMWGEDIGLLVSGTNPKPRQPDSTQPGVLSCLPSSSTAAAVVGDDDDDRNNNNHWCVLSDDWGEHEKLQLLPCSMYVPGDDVKERRLTIHAIPIVCDEGEYLLHSPESGVDGEITCEGYHVTVDFQFWIQDGIMHFFAPALPFTLGVPILQTDERQSGISPLANLLEIKSARWGCVIYYMAVAADVSEGKTLDMDRFLRRVTDHRDHTVQHRPGEQFVNIDVCNKSVRTDAPCVERDPDKIWKFILSW